jgi:two-component system alkaline phosphatase synthesis response regulator PhoP
MTEKQEKILIIESDAGFADRVGAALNKNGYVAIVAKDGIDGLKLMNEAEPQLVLLNVSLADMDSYELLAKKQENPDDKKIPLFLVSTQGIPINMRRVPQNSVIEFIMSLHSNEDDILDKVNRYFGHEVVMPEPIPGAEKRTKVLWVEDDKLIGTILAKKLISSGFDLFHAKTGEEAVEALKQVIPDVVVLDLLLPGMNGFDVLQQINRDASLRNVPTMILSNLSKPTDIERAKMLGAKKFLVKAATSLDQIVKEVRELSQSK